MPSHIAFVRPISLFRPSPARSSFNGSPPPPSRPRFVRRFFAAPQSRRIQPHAQLNNSNNNNNNSNAHNPTSALTTTSPQTPSSSSPHRPAARCFPISRRLILPMLAICARVMVLLPVFAPLRAVALSAIPIPWQQSLDPQSFLSGLTASFVLILASEIGDKTFFISALLSMKYSRVLVLFGSILALGAMTVISVLIGQIFHALPASLNTSIPFDDYAAVALLVWFGFNNIRDALAMRNDEDEELQDAKDLVEEKSNANGGAVRVVAETSSLIFLAEWGDKSMLATVALAAAKSPWGVIVGGVSGHFVASIIAVLGGSFLGKYISERSARLIGGVLFLVFAVLTIIGIY